MRLQNKFDGFSDDTGVSPVVKVALIVAIVVILSAVIARFAFGYGGQVQQSAQAEVSFNESDGTSVDIHLDSVQSADYIYVESSATSSDISGGGVGPNGYSDGPGGQQYLLANDSGGAGTTITLNSSKWVFDW